MEDPESALNEKRYLYIKLRNWNVVSPLKWDSIYCRELSKFWSNFQELTSSCIPTAHWATPGNLQFQKKRRWKGSNNILWKWALLVICFTIIKSDVNKMISKYQITSDHLKNINIYHMGIEKFTTITCCYQKKKELRLQYANYYFCHNLVVSLSYFLPHVSKSCPYAPLSAE